MSRKNWTVWLVLLQLAVLLAPDRAAHAEEMYRYVDGRGVVHLTNVPVDTRFRKYAIGSAGGTGKGVLILARRESSRIHIPGMSQNFAMHLGTQKPAGRLRSPNAYDQLISRIAARHGLPAAMVKAVVRAESNFQPHARSNKGAQGLMQLMPATAEDMGVSDPFEAEDNVQGGSRYLRAMYERFGDWKHALAAYNAGPGAVERFGGIPPFAETQQYVERVLHYYHRYDGDFSR